jgi:N-acetylglucosamine-6-sulfatase
VSDKPSYIQEMPLIDAAGDLANEVEFRQRRECLMAVDEMVKAIIDALGNKIDNTIIIYTSDNGWSQGDHRKIGKNLQYESASKVPLIIRWPGIPGGQVRSQLVNNLDLTATVLDLAGATATNPLDGVSLKNLIRDDTIPWRTSILIEAGHYSPEKYRSYSVRSNDWLYAESYFGGTSVVFHEVYNQTLDPYQLKNEVAPSKTPGRFYSRVKDYFRGGLNTLKICVGPSCWIEAFPALPKEKTDE